MKRYTIKEVCRVVEGASREDLNDGFGYESSYSILDNQFGDYLYDFASRETALWYEEHNYDYDYDFTPEEVQAQ